MSSSGGGAALERKSVRVTIFNQPYTLAASDEPGEVEALARNVDELMTSIAMNSKSSNLDGGRIAVLACLHLADQLRSTQAEVDRHAGDITENAAAVEQARHKVAKASDELARAHSEMEHLREAYEDRAEHLAISLEKAVEQTLRPA